MKGEDKLDPYLEEFEQQQEECIVTLESEAEKPAFPWSPLRGVCAFTQGTTLIIVLVILLASASAVGLVVGGLLEQSTTIDPAGNDTHTPHPHHAPHGTHAPHGSHAPHGTHSPHGTHAPHPPHAPHGTHGTHAPHAPHGTPAPHPPPSETNSSTEAPTDAPDSSVTVEPTLSPQGSEVPTQSPISPETLVPSLAPAEAPIAVGVVTSVPSSSPTNTPTETDAPTDAPTSAPTDAPSPPLTRGPSPSPTLSPSSAPTQLPTRSPIPLDSAGNTSTPTGAPSEAPTIFDEDSNSTFGFVEDANITSNESFSEEFGSEFEGDLALSYEQIAELYGADVANDYFNVSENATQRLLQEASSPFPKRWPCTCDGKYIVPYEFEGGYQSPTYNKYLPRIRGATKYISSVNKRIVFFNFDKGRADGNLAKLKEEEIPLYWLARDMKLLEIHEAHNGDTSRCFATSIGYRETGLTRIVLGGCPLYANKDGEFVVPGSDLHEVLHIMGFAHEQTRPRAYTKYVELDLEALKEAAKTKPKLLKQYKPMAKDPMPQVGDGSKGYYSKMPYDYGSIMHYTRFLEARKIRRLLEGPSTYEGNNIRFQRVRLGKGDKEKLKEYYPDGYCEQEKPQDRCDLIDDLCFRQGSGFSKGGSPFVIQGSTFKIKCHAGFQIDTFRRYPFYRETKARLFQGRGFGIIKNLGKISQFECDMREGSTGCPDMEISIDWIKSLGCNGRDHRGLYTGIIYGLTRFGTRSGYQVFCPDFGGS